MANNIFSLEIISPTGIVFSEQVNEINLPTAEGEITILPNHASLFTKVTEGEIKISKDGKESFIAVTGGFLEISNNKVIILSDYAVKAESIEIAKSEEAKKRAEELLREKRENVDFSLIEKDLQRSILELKVADRVKKRNRP